MPDRAAQLALGWLGRGMTLLHVVYADRAEAGDVLARELASYAGRDDVVVLGLPRGGVPVAARVATALRAPLDVLIVRKLGLPRQPELAMGAIAGIGDAIEMVGNPAVLARARPSRADVDRVLRAETDELRRRQRAYRGPRAAVPVEDRAVLVIDDGLATGSTMRAAIAALRHQRPASITVVAPVGSPRTCVELAALVDDVVCPWQPPGFYAVGAAYRDFRPVEDAEVTQLLDR